MRYGRKLNNRARALVADALERLASGDCRDLKGSHGRSFADQLVHELLEAPLNSLMRIDAATPSDEGDGKSEATGGNVNIQALYLTAVQQANKPGDDAKLVEGTSGVQPDVSDW